MKYNYDTQVSSEAVYYPEWELLCEKTGSSSYMYTDIAAHQNERGGYENETFRIMPFDWSENADENAPNFLYKPTGFAIQWYKYPFRGAWMTESLSAKQLRRVFQACLNSIEEEVEDELDDID